MTENEAKDFVQGKLDCMNKCDVFDCKGTDECDNCQYCYSQGNFGKQKKAFETAIKAVEEIQQYRAIGTVEEVRMLKDYKELYDVYKLIGTIEEFRNLKYKKNVLPIATIEFSKEDMQKMVDEKVAQIELDIQGIRAKAIDEFAEKIKKKGIEDGWNCDDVYGNSCGVVSCEECENIFLREIDEIAEQMKVGGKNERNTI